MSRTFQETKLLQSIALTESGRTLRLVTTYHTVLAQLMADQRWKEQQLNSTLTSHRWQGYIAFLILYD